MTLKPTDMLEIQSAIDDYERKYPRRAEPSAEVALAWRLGKREAAKRLASMRDETPISTRAEKYEPEFAQQECSRLAWAWQQMTLRLQIWTAAKADDSEAAAGLLPWVKGLLMVGWWGAVAVAVASIFFFGAFVGGFK